MHVGAAETITGIALTLGVPEHQLRRENNMARRQGAYLGRRLKVPGAGAKKSDDSSNPARPMATPRTNHRELTRALIKEDKGIEDLRNIHDKWGETDWASAEPRNVPKFNPDDARLRDQARCGGCADVANECVLV